MSIHQVVSVNKTPKAVYEMLTDAKKFAALSGGKARISRKPGGAISLFDGDMTGFTIELVPNKRVVQAWRANYWPKGVYSIVRFELAKDGKGTRLTFDQAGHPDDDEAALAEGWRDYYWAPMNAS
ncbi:MAG: SRPBCC domain-containing protein [Cucumibacter sp.]